MRSFPGDVAETLPDLPLKGTSACTKPPASSFSAYSVVAIIPGMANASSTAIRSKAGRKETPQTVSPLRQRLLIKSSSVPKPCGSRRDARGMHRMLLLLSLTDNDLLMFRLPLRRHNLHRGRSQLSLVDFDARLTSGL